jgi:hypothetical protein
MKGKEREAMHKKSQKCYNSHSHGGGIPNATPMKLKSLVYMVNIINFAEFDHCSFNGLNLARVQSLSFSHS